MRAKAALLADEVDAVIVDYALAQELVIVTFDRDMRSKTVRRHCRVLWIDGPEWTSRDRVKGQYAEAIEFLVAGERLVTVPREGQAFAGAPQRMQRRPQGGRRRRR